MKLKMKTAEKIHAMRGNSFIYPSGFLPALAIAVAIIAVHSTARADTLYVGAFGGPIEQFTANGVGSTFNSDSFSPLCGMAFDASGNLFVANSSSSTIQEISPSGAVHLFTTTGLSEPTGLAFDSSGNLYAANVAGNIEKFTPGGVGSFFANANSGDPVGLAFDKAGNLFVAIESTGTIEKITPGGAGSVFATGLNNPFGLAFDSSGDLYASEQGAIEKFTPGGAGSLFAKTGSSFLEGLAFDSSGNLFTVRGGTNGTAILEYAPNGTGSVFANLPGFGNFSIAIIPEPSTLILLGFGFPVLLAFQRRKRKAV